MLCDVFKHRVPENSPGETFPANASTDLLLVLVYTEIVSGAIVSQAELRSFTDHTQFRVI